MLSSICKYQDVQHTIGLLNLFCLNSQVWLSNGTLEYQSFTEPEEPRPCPHGNYFFVKTQTSYAFGPSVQTDPGFRCQIIICFKIGLRVKKRNRRSIKYRIYACMLQKIK